MSGLSDLDHLFVTLCRADALPGLAYSLHTAFLSSRAFFFSVRQLQSYAFRLSRFRSDGSTFALAHQRELA